MWLTNVSFDVYAWHDRVDSGVELLYEEVYEL